MASTPTKVNVILGLVLPVLLVLHLVKYLLSPIYRLLRSSRVPTVVRTPESRFGGLEKLGYPFSPNYYSIDAGCGVTLPRVHYVDEGPKNGPVVLCLHGEPAWSFLYRKMVPPLVAAGYRVVVPDFIGFGKSDKYTDPSHYTHELHCMVLRKLLDHLQLKEITLVCQDWGGLTGLSVVKDAPHLFSSLVIMNTGIPTGFDFAERKDLLKLLPFTVWRTSVLLFGTFLPVHLLFSRFLKSKDPAIPNAYSAPFPSSLYKAGAARWPLLVPMIKDDPVTAHMMEAKECLSKWSKPALVMFSTGDPVTRGQDKVFLKLIPHAKEKVVEGAGHFLQESHGEELADNILEFLKSQN